MHPRCRFKYAHVSKTETKCSELELDKFCAFRRQSYLKSPLHHAAIVNELNKPSALLYIPVRIKQTAPLSAGSNAVELLPVRRQLEVAVHVNRQPRHHRQGKEAVRRAPGGLGAFRFPVLLRRGKPRSNTGPWNQAHMGGLLRVGDCGRTRPT